MINSETLNRDLKKRIRKSQYIATTDIESSSNIAAAWLMRGDFIANDIRAIEALNSNPTFEDKLRSFIRVKQMSSNSQSSEHI